MLSYIEHFHILSDQLLKSLFDILELLFGIPVRITSSAIGIKIFPITAGIIKFKSITKKKQKKHDKTVLFAKSKIK